LGKSDLFESLGELSKEESRKGESLKNFYNLLEDLKTVADERSLTKTVKYIVDKVGYEQYLKQMIMAKNGSLENLEERMENIQELLTVARSYDSLSPSEGRGRFLEEIALLQDADRSKDDVPRVNLMTIHSSKGLEFPIVFIVGMEEGLFPHSRSIYQPHEMEEERRLCYVAITRAKEHLVLTYAKYRNIFGSTEVNLPSRFLSEMPQHLLDYQLVDPDQNYEEILHYD